MPVDPAEPVATKVSSGATVRDVADLLGLSSAELIKKLMMMGEMATLTQTLTDESIKSIADEYDRKIEIVSAAEEEIAAPVFAAAPSPIDRACGFHSGDIDSRTLTMQDACRGREDPMSGLRTRLLLIPASPDATVGGVG